MAKSVTQKNSRSLEEQLKPIRAELKDIRSKMATKAELKAIRAQMATKDDLISLEKRIRNDMASKDDLKKFATRDDLETLRTQMTTDMTSLETRITENFGYKLTSLETRLRQDMATKTDLETAVAQIIEVVDRSSANKDDVSRLKTRVDRIEDHLNLTTLK